MKTILVIEDEQAIRESLCDLLEFEGFSVLDAELGKEGVQLAEARLPDLILCDVHMPDMDGYHVLSHLRQSPHARTIPFIFLTAKGARADQRYGMNLGADDYLVKPCTSEEILAAIASRIDRQDTLRHQSQHQLNTLRNNIALSLPHELHTPLNNILLFAEILMSEYESIDRKEILEISEGIHTSATRLHRLIQNFLFYAQLEIAANDPAKRASLCSGQTALPHIVITEVATRLARQAGREADLVLRLEDAAIRMSDLHLQKVVEELIGNALKFSNVGHQVCVSSTLSLGGFVIRIVDHGRGMTPEQIASLGAYMQFDRRFYEQQGAGLGLIIAKRMLELHDGSLTIESIVGKQTCIKAIVPLEPQSHQNF